MCCSEIWMPFFLPVILPLSSDKLRSYQYLAEFWQPLFHVSRNWVRVSNFSSNIFLWLLIENFVDKFRFKQSEGCLICSDFCLAKESSILEWLRLMANTVWFKQKLELGSPWAPQQSSYGKLVNSLATHKWCNQGPPEIDGGLESNSTIIRL